jgi:hypothetical protein
LTGFFGVGRGISQGLKPRFLESVERPKAEALGYLEAKADFSAWLRNGRSIERATTTANANAKAKAKARARARVRVRVRVRAKVRANAGISPLRCSR